MFTGIIEEIGSVLYLRKTELFAEIKIGAKVILEDIKIGDSISTNGVCLTVTDFSANSFSAQIMAETMRKSNLGRLMVNSQVNLERALKLGGRLGGHFVSGHIDGIGKIINISHESEAIWLTICPGDGILKYIVNKGSVAIDGISLTIAYVDDKVFKVSIIPHTRSYSTLGSKNNGDEVNLECDIIGKYVDKLVQYKKSNITLNYLKEMGF